VKAILGRVADVVERVDAGGDQTKGDEGQTDARGHAVVAQRSGGPGSGDDEQILDPLAWPSRDQDRQQPTTTRADLTAPVEGERGGRVALEGAALPL